MHLPTPVYNSIPLVYLASGISSIILFLVTCLFHLSLQVCFASLDGWYGKCEKITDNSHNEMNYKIPELVQNKLIVIIILKYIIHYRYKPI